MIFAIILSRPIFVGEVAEQFKTLSVTFQKVTKTFAGLLTNSLQGNKIVGAVHEPPETISAKYHAGNS